MVAEVHYAFPLAIYTKQLDNYEEFNRVILDNIAPYDFTSTDEVLTGEWLGKISMHHNPLFKDLYKTVSDCAKDYVNFLGMRDDIFEYHFTKSWLSIIDKPQYHMGYHTHSISDISWVYYVEIPENADVISFSNMNRPNELFDGLMDDSREVDVNEHNNPQGKTFFRERNTPNYNTFFIPPHPGLLVMFPGKQKHGTVPHPQTTEPQLGKRTAVVGDINMHLKHDYLKFESGRINVNFMRTFD